MLSAIIDLHQVVEPIIKNMWTSSFMLLCAGWSLVFLAVFYLIIDVLGVWRWSFFFIVIGMNPILDSHSGKQKITLKTLAPPSEGVINLVHLKLTPIR